MALCRREMLSMFKHMGAQLDKTLSVSGDTMELAPIQDEVRHRE